MAGNSGQAQAAVDMGSLCYSLTLPAETAHSGYERVLLEEVSCELLHITDAEEAEEGRRVEEEEGSLVAVAFRRRGE